MPIPFALNPALDATALARRFARDGRVRIADLLSRETAEALHAGLRGRGDWRHVVNSGAKVIELSRAARADMTEAQRRQLDDAVYAAARTGFQFRYETLRVPDGDAERRQGDDPLFAFADWFSQGAARDLLRRITATPQIDFADAQATAFAPGDFLTGHDDVVDGRKRHAAYVLGLNPIWRPEWGGLLLFHDADGLVGQAPAFNTLDVFRVGQLHSVSEVTRAAAYRRYSITGWLRSR
jgi:Rps23 Pro-64 3,4-dihydroxylase Tpa1-like proline 4-hydroxylase